MTQQYLVNKTYFTSERYPENIKQRLLSTILQTLRKNRERYLAPLSTEKILSKLNQVVKHWLNLQSPIRQKAENLLTQTTGCSKEVISEGLDLAFNEVRHLFLRKNAKILSQFPRPQLSSFIFGGMVPTPMLFDIFMGLLLKSAVIVKTPSRAPFFPILLAHSIYEVDPSLGSCVKALWWPGGKWNLEKMIFKEADLIHAYGDDKSIKEIEALIPPKKIFIKFGHKVSFSVIGKEKLKGPLHLLAEKMAYDICLYDQQGCVSPHVIYLEKVNFLNPIAWTRALADAMEKMTRKFPPGHLSLGEASLIHQIRGQYSLREKTLCLSSHPNPNWTVIYEENPEFHPSCLNRVIFIKPIAHIKNLPQILKKWRGNFQALGYAVSPERKKEVERISKSLSIPFLLPIGSMQNTSFKDHIEERLNQLRNN
ncbi:MAG: hypothetical protein HYS07_07430 [Chlamydiae bacterium]|nr:hypothetical protein [Chlamydiota bacterium]MBI3276666.1 hypothetical protein [Chlamydiota bacterium]